MGGKETRVIKHHYRDMQQGLGVGAQQEGSALRAMEGAQTDGEKGLGIVSSFPGGSLHLSADRAS